MNQVEAYQFLNRRFIAMAEEQGVQFAPRLGRERMVRDGFGLPYFEIEGGVTDRRWFSIDVIAQGLDAQADPFQPDSEPSMKIFASDLEANAPLLWKLRCAWFNFQVDWEQAEADVHGLLGNFAPSGPQA